MLKKLYTFTLLFIVSEGIYSQECDNGRYYEEIFNVNVTSDVYFGEAPQPTLINPNNIQQLFLDVYEPDEEDPGARPLIIWAFGGGFIFGSKESPDIVSLSNAFAKRGFVCAAIDYRLSTDLVVNGNDSNAYEAVLKAMHDMRASIRFFYKDASGNDEFKIDTNKIYIGGVSAGAIAALQIAHLDETEEIPEEMESIFLASGGFEGNSGNPGFSEKIAGVISLCGAVLDTTWINPAVNIPILSMHGTQDEVVPYGSDTLTLLNIAIEVDGSSSIHIKLDESQIFNQFYSWQGANHTPFVLNPESEASAYMDTTIWFVRDFLYNLVCNGGVSAQENLTNELLPIRLFPNPNKGSFFMEFNSGDELFIKILDDLGRLIYEDRLTQPGLLNFQFPCGLYTALVTCEKSGRMASKKFIVYE